MNYAKPRPMDTRRPADAEEIFTEHEAGGDEPIIFGFFRRGVPTAVREFSADVVVRPDGSDRKPVSNVSVAIDWFLRIDLPKRDYIQRALVKETIIEAFEVICEQNPPDRILPVADNHGSYHAKLTQERADELDAEFVFIPPYSPTLNAIEPLWKSTKREIPLEICEDKDHFIAVLTEIFLRLGRRVSFASNWIETFLSDVQKLR